MDTKRLIIYPVLFAITLAIATLGFTRFGSEGLLIPFLVTLGYFTVFFIIAQIIKDNSIVDIGWGLGFVFGSVAALIITKEPTILSYIIVAFIALWGLRLSGRLIKRNWKKPEDFRYQQWRKEWGNKVVLMAFFRVFMIQGLINFTVGAAAYAIIMFNDFAFSSVTQYVVYLGLFIAVVGLFFEVVGDEQLRKHIQSKEGGLMDKGLWSLTRHPNYYGEILIWVGIYLAGLSMLSGAVNTVFYLFLVLSPIIMSTVLIKVSTPLLEKHMEKYEGWDDYKKRAPMIFPWGHKN